MSEIKKAEPVAKVAREVPAPPKPVIDIPGMIANLHRGINPDVKALSKEQRVALIVALNNESKAEGTFQYPAKEQARERLRKQLA